MKTKEILDFIKNGEKKSLWKIYQHGQVHLENAHKDTLTDRHVEMCYVNSKIGMLKEVGENIRIEPGCYIREHVQIACGCIFMMGCVVNIGACVDEMTMIDMGAIIGAGAIIGKRCHIGANAVLAGCLEPVSAKAVVLEDDVFIGANATILEGIHIGKGAIVGAGSVVTKDVEAYTTVVGIPARVIKKRDESGWHLTKELR